MHNTGVFPCLLLHLIAHASHAFMGWTTQHNDSNGSTDTEEYDQTSFLWNVKYPVVVNYVCPIHSRTSDVLFFPIFPEEESCFEKLGLKSGTLNFQAKLDGSNTSSWHDLLLDLMDLVLQRWMPAKILAKSAWIQEWTKYTKWRRFTKCQNFTFRN